MKKKRTKNGSRSVVFASPPSQPLPSTTVGVKGEIAEESSRVVYHGCLYECLGCFLLAELTVTWGELWGYCFPKCDSLEFVFRGSTGFTRGYSKAFCKHTVAIHNLYFRHCTVPQPAQVYVVRISTDFLSVLVYTFKYYIIKQSHCHISQGIWDIITFDL